MFCFTRLINLWISVPSLHGEKDGYIAGKMAGYECKEYGLTETDKYIDGLMDEKRYIIRKD